MHLCLRSLAEGDGGLEEHTAGVADWWRQAAAAAAAGGDLPQAPPVACIWQAAESRRWTSGRSGGLHAQYQAHMAPIGDEHTPTPGCPPKMPWYFRHTSRFASHEHARCLMRLRCLSTPLLTCSYNAGEGPALPSCPRCPLGVPCTIQHVLLDCPATSHLRADPRFAVTLFMGPLPLAGRLRAFMRTPHQYALAKYVSECLSHEPALGS